MTDADKAKQHGNYLFNLGKYQQALTKYSDAINLNPLEPAYYNNRALTYMKMENYEFGLRDCREALNINPGLSKSLLRAGKCSMMLGEFQQAVDSIN